MEREDMNPAAGGAADGVQEPSLAGERPEDNSRPKRRKPRLTVRLASGLLVTVRGRQAQTLALLLERGPLGLTSGEASPLGWARRTANYVRKLRQAGVAIVTLRERAGDAVIGRYVLVDPLPTVVASEGLDA